MIPMDVDYSYSDNPLHLAEPVFDKYFGGVTLFPTKIFEKINGYSNKYWGWGYEDDDLFHRCLHHNVQTDSVKNISKGSSEKAFKFNGIDSYIKIKEYCDKNTLKIGGFIEKTVLNHINENNENK
jgi:predicted glycosyltransferase involved in capsule biosynthesis